MFLRKVEISGFKSFADRTVLDFSPDGEGAERRLGITAIVGPNGSGKSNVADAIRWAIGEQSSKNLRGKKSEDVIFGGTAKRGKVGSASVTLHFENRDHRIPIEYEEVAIRRKLHRSGESEFLINGAKVRLLDIVDLLAKSGIGKDSYCVITQGMSDATLSATPVERRAIFEDAAGVKQYQIQKERAVRKLESTKENLSRVDALLVEIEPHLRILRRQAERFSQGKDVAERLLAKQTELYGYLWHSFQGERGGLSEEREDLARRAASLERETDTLRDEAAGLAKTLEDGGRADSVSQDIAKSRGELNALERDAAILSGRIEAELDRQKDREEVRTIPVDLGYIRKSLERIGANQRSLFERLGNVERLEDIQDIREFARAIGQEVVDLDTKVEAGKVTEKVTISLPEDEKRQSDSRIAAFRKEQKESSERMEALRADIAAAEGRLRAEREKGREARERYFLLERQVRDKERELSAAKDRLNDVKVRLARIEVREEDLVNEVREELSVDVRDLAWDGNPRDRDALMREIIRLKGEAERIGAIDPLVAQEYEETEKRFTFLSTESEDLRKAMASLEEVIREMDERIEKEFSAAFDEIARKFSHYFSLIFNGGKAELVRIAPKRKTVRVDDDGEPADGEDVASQEAAGIEITACPPGKRISNLSMLSGGERSLTSLALLFAIISHNPPPFAVLDEVEAALDEANSRRFGKVLSELSERTQFIVITHNRETMRQASLLYGVTMGDDGSSQILSLHLEDIEKFRGAGKKTAS
ncbi:MAG: AAA family ATPase [Candidatus Moranbacteria bacterium]|nr:AAA family ATPase [Candidatus Moranbacteria bacterium]